ncbi:MAG: GGDEF domain-containing protein [Deltaproteobacteria bacterium]
MSKISEAPLGPTLELLRQAHSLSRSLLAAASSPEFGRLACAAGGVLGGGAAAMLGVDPATSELRVEESEGLMDVAVRRFHFVPTESFSREAYELASHGDEPPRLADALRNELGFRVPVTQPLGWPGPLRGLLAIDACGGGLPPELRVACVRQFGASVAAAHAALWAREPARRTGSLDSLTNLPDRQSAEQQLRRELARARRYREPLSLVLFDLDRFDEVNERHGCACGDQVLREISHLLVGVPSAGRDSNGLALCFRETDLATRFGPDSFLVVLPATSQEGAFQAAERFLAGLRQHRFSASSGGAPVASATASAAVVTFPDDASSVEGLLERAELLVAAAAQAGGDRAVRAAPGSPQKLALGT